MKLFKEKTTRTIFDSKSGLIIHEQTVREPSMLALALGLLPAIAWMAFKFWFAS